MTWKSRAYILLILLGGLSLVAELNSQWHCEDPERFTVFAALAVLTSFWRFQLPGMSGTLSASFLFVLISAVQLGVMETLAIGACGAVGTVFANYKSRGLDRALEALFRLSSAMIAAHVTGRLFNEVFPQVSFLHFPVRLALTGLAYFVCASLPLAILEAFTSGARIATAWRNCSFWTLPYYVIGTGVAGFLWAVHAYDDLQASILVVPAVFALFRWYELYAGRLEAEKAEAVKERAAAESNANLHLRTIHVLARAIDAREQATGDQLRRIQVYCTGIARELGLDETQRMALAAASLLHDVGNLAVPEHITTKPGRLTAEEFDRIKVHAVVGAEMLEGVRFPYPVAPIVRYHHERWDGTGYPDGLAGNAIPIGARILGAVDVFVALTSDRIYRPALSIRHALSYLRDEAGGTFDPRVVEIILDRWEQFEANALGTGADPAPSLNFINTIAATKEEEHFLNTMSARLLNCSDIPTFFTSLGEKLRGAVPFDSFAFFRRNGEELAPLAAGGVESDGFRRLRISIGTGATGQSAQHCCIKYNMDPVDELGALTSLRSSIAVPIMGSSGQECIGVLTLYSRTPSRYTKDDGRILTAVAGRMSHLIENIVRVRAAEGAATTDELTNLPNARGLSTEMRRRCDHAMRAGEALSVLVLDLDGFKKLNDTHGHLAGNRALQAIAAGAREVLGSSGFIARMGGDEFVALFPAMARPQVVEQAEKLQRMVEAVGVNLVGTPMLSTSWGLASFGPDGHLPEALLSAADKRMYEYKRTKEERTAARLARLAEQVNGSSVSSSAATASS